ncbi:hypothetical protein B0H17DRAFT_1145120 [Mycena rosella]|uniref:Uncharacterized protein n=1 Tax=Mycena rosella TaxID=1033263 RepID=A0AAD7CRY8_MYCRO|nr:hypothetical protein B0H17DRAFT_1145120 [Mycena rosella]
MWRGIGAVSVRRNDSSWKLVHGRESNINDRRVKRKKRHRRVLQHRFYPMPSIVDAAPASIVLGMLMNCHRIVPEGRIGTGREVVDEFRPFLVRSVVQVQKEVVAQHAILDTGSESRYTSVQRKLVVIVVPVEEGERRRRVDGRNNKGGADLVEFRPATDKFEGAVYCSLLGSVRRHEPVLGIEWAVLHSCRNPICAVSVFQSRPRFEEDSEHISNFYTLSRLVPVTGS